MNTDGPDMVAITDQAKAELATLAELQGTYYRELRSHGFDDWAALQLVQQWTQNLNDQEERLMESTQLEIDHQPEKEQMCECNPLTVSGSMRFSGENFDRCPSCHARRRPEEKDIGRFQ